MKTFFAVIALMFCAAANAGVSYPPIVYGSNFPLPKAAAGWTFRGRTPTISCVGNSICWYGRWGEPVGYSIQFSASVSEMGNLLMFAGGSVQQECNITSGGSTFDQCGNFGDPAQTCPTIEADLITYVNTWGILGRYAPDIWYDDALVENDINAGSTASAIETCVQNLVNFQLAYSPGSVVLIGTPHSDGRISGNSSAIAVHKAVHDWMLNTFDNGETIFAYDQSQLYNDTGNVACTVSGWSACPLVGYTYTNNPSDALSTVSIHPRQNAASLVGRAAATALKRIVGHVPRVNGISQGNNINLAGSVSATNTHTTGTSPSNSSIVLPPTGAASALVSTACNPGCWNLNFTADPTQPIDSFTARTVSKQFALSASRFRMYVQVKVNSGSANLAGVFPVYTATFTDASQQTFRYNQTNGVANPGVQPVVFQDGDVLTFLMPPTSLTAGKTLQSTGNGNIIADIYFNFDFVNTTPVSLTILAMNVIPLDAPGTPVTLSVGASPYCFQNPNSATTTIPTTGKGKIIVNGGTVTAITFNRPYGTAYSENVTGSEFILDKGDTLCTTYTTAPTEIWVPFSP